MEAMIFAAGLGTRLKPLTDNYPKALVKVNDKPLLQWNIEALIKAGVNHIVINVHHHASIMFDFIRSLNYPHVKITISDESDELLDTGGGLKKAANLFQKTEPIIVQNVDILSGIDYKQMLEFHNKNQAIATLAVRYRESSRYLIFNNHNILCGWENIKTDASIVIRETGSEELKRIAFSGIHILSPEIFAYFPNQEVFSMIDLYLQIGSNKDIHGFDHTSDYWFDIGSMEKLKSAERYFTH
jgi:N-acetyl-alpha-D-muramate 1-phosphate uridylyltransferase